MPLPAVSIVIPVRNEIEAIRPCLEAVLAQDYDNILEIIIADGSSSDGTRPLLGKLAHNWPLIILLDNPQRTQTTGLNMAIRHTRGEIIVRLDAHATYAPDYIRQCVSALEQSGAGCVGGGVNLLRSNGFWPTLFGLVQEHPLGTGVARFRRTGYEGYVDTVWPGAYRREVFEQVGLFREALTRTEDLDFHARLRRQGYKIWQTPLIRPYYRPRSTIGGIARQYFSNGEQVIETLLVNLSAIALRHLVPYFWITVLLLGAIGALFLPVMRLGFLGLIVLYGLVCLISAVMIAAKHGLRYFWLSPWIFPLIHLSYGLGSWFGVWQVLSRQMNRKSRDWRAIPRLKS